MSYVLYSPAHTITAPTGRIFDIKARALFRVKGLPDRRYRSEYPNPSDKDMFIAKFRTLEIARNERSTLEDYCGEKFEVHEWYNGALGKVVVDDE